MSLKRDWWGLRFQEVGGKEIVPNAKLSPTQQFCTRISMAAGVLSCRPPLIVGRP